ncbi:receptor-type tyrosine-protein phosphatase eta-like [Silurus meridionalis]|uniref:receptor-type tyrosine-protein phosphatase eta-like n=1 Tax=Silurus meridionalis TaxID=175797 RepID=UPI001EEB040C|nr:receptor-type tyrosine-protein phosphatase eta-like [Silurus meridionalis]
MVYNPRSFTISLSVLQLRQQNTVGLPKLHNPDVASNLTVSSKTTSSVSLTWNEPPGNRSYFTVQWTDGSVKNSSNTSTPYYTVTGLTAGVNYTFTVTAVAADTQTKGSPTQISAFTNPDVVTNLIVSNKTTSSVSLNWNEPNGNRRYFTVQWNDGSGNNIINASYTVTGLTAGVKYTFTVTAVAADNQTTGAPTKISASTNPDAVTNLTVSNKTTSSVSLTWNEPPGNKSYFILRWTGGSLNKSINISTTSYNVTGLTAGVNYTFTVTAFAGDGQNGGATTQISAFTNPDIVSNLSVSNKTTSSVSLNWNEPNGYRSYFTVQWNNGSVNNIINSLITSYTVTGLTAGVNYTYTVSAVAADTQTTGSPTQISAFTSNGEISYYVVQYDNFSTNISTTTEFTRTNITNLTPGVQYTFKVFAVVADNKTEGNFNYISAYTKPDVVKDLSVIEITTRSLFLNWTEPIGKRSFFKVQWSNNITLNSTTSNTFYNITNLSPGVNYTILISAVAADNITEGGAIGRSVFTKPDIVRNLKTSEVTTTSVFLSWTEPLGNRSFFRVQWINSSTTPKTSFNITGLTPGTNYTFTVSAVADDNKTEGSVVGLSICTGTSPVFNISCVGPNRTAAALNLTWTNPPGNNQGFNINLNSAFSKFTPFCNPVCNYFISNNLQYFNTYNLTISTLGCGEIGSWDFKCRTGVTDPPVPGKPEDVVIKVTSVCKTAVTLQFSSNLLNSANGPIEAYGVLLSTDPQSNNSKTFLRMTYNDWLQEKTKTYLTVLKLNNNIITKSNMILVEIGNDKGSDVISNEDFKNGPLSNQYYRVALVLFTYLKIRDGLVDIQQSIFSVTPFSWITAKPVDSQCKKKILSSAYIAAISLGLLLPFISLLTIFFMLRRYRVHCNNDQVRTSTESEWKKHLCVNSVAAVIIIQIIMK